MRTTEGWNLWLISANTFLLLVGDQYRAVPEAYVTRYGQAVVLKDATVAAFGQFIALLLPVALVLVAGPTLDRLAPPTPD